MKRIVLALLAVSSVQAVDVVDEALQGKLSQRITWVKSSRENGQIALKVHSLLQETLTPDSAAQIALLNNAGLQGKYEALGISQSDIAAAGLLKNPSLTAQSRWADRGAKNTNLEFSYSQDIADLFLNPLRKKLATLAYNGAQLALADDVLKLVSETKTAFYELQAAMQLLAHEELVVESNEASAEFAKKQREAGNITRLRLVQQQAIHSKSRLAVAQSRAEISQKREALNRLLGLWGTATNWKIAAKLPLLPKREIPLQNVESVAVSRRTDLEIGRAQLTLAATSLGIQGKTRMFPSSIRLGVDYERDIDGTQMAGPNIEVELPIFNNGLPELARRRAEFKQAQWALQGRAIDVRSEAREARDGLIAARDLAEFYRDELLPQQQEIVKGTQLEYNGMLTGFYELIRARQDELEAERGSVETLRDYWISRCKLEAALGGSLDVLTTDHSKD
ncbi:MAG: TolC family protein [Chthoniobacterales bacterium]